LHQTLPLRVFSLSVFPNSSRHSLLSALQSYPYGVLAAFQLSIGALEMNRSTFLEEEFEKDYDVIADYVPSKDGQSLDLEEIEIDELEYACGVLYSSVRELQNYIVALMNDGIFNDN
jgi:hypothetical protein